MFIPSEMFMTYFFKNKNDAKREIKFLKYIQCSIHN